MPARLRISNVSFSYGERTVIHDVSLAVEEGEIVGIVGPNGAGKSTLLRLLAGLARPQGGTIELGGRSLSAMPHRARARAIAFLPQATSFPFSHSALEIVLMGRAPHLPLFGFESAEEIDIAREAMRATDCLPLAHRPIDALSGGERQRVLVARALAQKPNLLILDEPTAFLDLRHQADLHRILRELRRARGTTIIAAMHDLNLAAALCQRIVILHEGRLAAEGPPAEIFTPELIGRVFGTAVRMVRDEESGTTCCLPFTPATSPAEAPPNPPEE